MSKDEIKQVFGVEMPHWEKQLHACLVGLADAVRRDPNYLTG